MKTKQRFFFAALAAIGFLTSLQASASGFEKNIMWSGRYSGAGGTALSFVDGSEAIYFNPAGLLSDRVGMDVSVNGTLISSQFQGPFRDDVTSKSKRGTSVPFGVTYDYTLNEKWAIGAGVYVSGGSKAEFEDVQVLPSAAAPFKPDIRTNIELVEVALGAAYRINKEFKVGAAYRIGFVNADFDTVITSGTTLINAKLSNLSDQNYGGFKLGAQYTPNEVWGLGLMFRSDMKFKVEGDSNGVASPSPYSSVVTMAPGTATAETHFPMQIAFGGHWNIEPGAWRGMLEYVFTQYSKDKDLHVTGTLNNTALNSTIALNWKDQSAVRIGGEYLRTNWPIRFGYVFTSQVTPESDARPTFTAPGSASTFTVGTGHNFNDALKLNLGADYTFISKTIADTASTTDRSGGKYATDAFSFHAGLQYLF